jgi:hypothetical protein
MADGQRGAPPLELQAIARDWITIWQSELSAMASDRELQDAWVRLVANWSSAAERMTRPRLDDRLDNAPGRARAAPAAGPTAPVAPLDDRDAALQRLANRVAELERRLALNAGRDGGGSTGA